MNKMGYHHASMLARAVEMKAQRMERVKRSRLWCFLPTLALILALPVSARTIAIDHVWSGSNPSFCGISENEGYVFAAYYNADRYLTVARVNLKTGEIDRHVTSSRFGGWDAHNNIVMALDSSKRLHVSGNMHAVPLVYFHSPTSLAVDDLSEQPMTGIAEDKVTYPKFLKIDDQLIFYYREGVSGNGLWYVNRWIDEAWTKKPALPIFGDRFEGRSANAYPSTAVRDKHGFFHFALAWRIAPDVSQTVAVSHVKTPDFVHWLTSAGEEVSVPVEPDAIGFVDKTGAGKGLVNGARISIARDGSPVISYTKYGPDGKNAIFVARFSEGAWSTHLVASARGRIEVTGGGSVPRLPSYSPVRFENGTAVIQVRFADEKPATVALDLATLQSLSEDQARETPRPHTTNAQEQSRPRDDLAGTVDAQIIRVAITKHTADAPGGYLEWAAQGPHRDRPRPCTPVAPRACDPPPSILQLVLP